MHSKSSSEVLQASLRKALGILKAAEKAASSIQTRFNANAHDSMQHVKRLSNLD